jgi:hypothetical protein
MPHARVNFSGEALHRNVPHGHASHSQRNIEEPERVTPFGAGSEARLSDADEADDKSDPSRCGELVAQYSMR